MTKVDVALPLHRRIYVYTPHLSTFTSSHAHSRRSASPPPYIAPAHAHCHSFTSTLSFSLSTHLFDSAGQLHVSLSGQPSSSSKAAVTVSIRRHLWVAPLCAPTPVLEERHSMSLQLTVPNEKQVGCYCEIGRNLREVLNQGVSLSRTKGTACHRIFFEQRVHSCTICQSQLLFGSTTFCVCTLFVHPFSSFSTCTLT